MYKRRWHSHQQRETTNKKSLAGFLGCWIVSSIASLLFLQLPLDQHSCMYACGIGLCGALAEFIYLGVDDNLSLPVLSAFFQTIMGRYLS
jgi:dolichol kinase